MAVKKGVIDVYLQKPEQKKVAMASDPRIDYPEEWQDLLEHGYKAPYMGKDGPTFEMVDLKKEPCPDSSTMPFCMLLRRCNKMHYIEVTADNRKLTRFAYCEPRACYNHFEECPFR